MGRLGRLGKGEGGAGDGDSEKTATADVALWRRKLAEMEETDAQRKAFKTTVSDLKVRHQPQGVTTRRGLPKDGWRVDEKRPRTARGADERKRGRSFPVRTLTPPHPPSRPPTPTRIPLNRHN
jgi:hypothetical protein